MKTAKKFAAGLLVLTLLSSLALPSLAAGADLDERLKAVTLKVKETLDIGDDYTEFTGNLTESDPADQWSLYWSKDDESLQVRATEEGKILYYYLYRNTIIYSGDTGNIAKFPDSAETALAKKAAEAFLEKVLDTGIESVDLESYTDSVLRYYSSGSCSFYGILKLNGTDTPISVNLSVDTDDMKVVSFYRGDNGENYSSLPAPDQAISLSAASPVLFSTVNMYLSYALRTGGDDKTAYLQYTPVSDGNYAVDAITGKLVSLNLYTAYMGYEDAKIPSVAYDGAAGLTQVELDTAAGLKDILSRDTLEAAARSISEFGITSDFSLRSVNYYAGTGDATGNVTAYLYFYSSGTGSGANISEGSAPVSDKVSSSTVSAYKYVALDAKTAALLSFSSYRSSDEKDPALLYTRAQAETVARNFLAKYEPDRLAASSLASSDDAEGSEYCTFVYQHAVNGIPFPQNALYVTVDAVTGGISAFSVSWTDGIQFVSAANIISSGSAKELYTAAKDLALSYVYVMEEEESGLADPHLLLAYTFDSRNTVWGVDAVSGELLRSESAEDSKLAYDDISAHYAKDKIDKLAQYGIGFSGGSFFPNRQLTQRDLLALLVSACGNYYYGTPVSKSQEDSLYLSAYSLGILTKEEKAPDSLVTKAELVMFVLRAAGYGRAAEIPGIYVVNFADAAAVPSDLTGYVAIARGLGIISGTPGGKFLPNQVATRAEAAVVLYNYMST